MAIDLSGGLSEDREYVFEVQPDNPEMRESVNVWVWDNGADFGIPRMGIEAVGDQWETHDLQVNIALADGRILNIFEPGKVHDPMGADRRPRIFGAGPLSFELVEPFRHWRGKLHGSAVATTVANQIAGRQADMESGSRVPVELDIDIRSAVPPWECGSLREEAGRVLATQDEGAMMGGPRFEQLFRATGSLRVGEKVHPLEGGGLRIRRQGIRRTATFRGHVWQSTVFPSGRAFGAMLYPPRNDGKPTFNEAFLFDGDGDLIAARVVNPPWLRTLRANGEDVSVVLESDRGITTIDGETIHSAFHHMGPVEDLNNAGSVRDFQLQQAIARYTWDGETANGMLERSSPRSQIEPS
jgi:hypothetical protein